ncbi:hypothetical protein G9A89_017421 [Geosiphon pyriformis]|nr:hypothetical protein G9A89_017421 [Geosiphon pyriformis]
MAKVNPFIALSEVEEVVDYEALEAESWRDPILPTQTSQDAEDTTAWREDLASNAVKRANLPDEVWLIPPNIRPIDILGDNKKINMQRIVGNTNTHMQYNETEAQIEIWGTRQDLDQALKQWNSLASNLLTEQEQERRKRKVKGWAKPEKALTEKQLAKLERRRKREEEQKDYQGYPPDRKLFNGFFVFPNKEIPVAKIVGEKEEVLNPVRAETKCYMWYEPGENLFKVVGDDYGSVEEATLRIKHLYLKIVALRSIPKIARDEPTKSRGWSYHMIEQPQKPTMVKISKPPTNFKGPHDVTGIIKLLEPVFQGGDPSSVLEKGVATEEKESKTNAYYAATQTINTRNLAKIENALLQALATVHLFDEEIKMRIRFGHVCLTDFPKEPLWPIDKLNDKILSDSRLLSKFATCLADNKEALNPLFESLSEREQQWEGSPFREFKIRATRLPTARGTEKWQCTFDVQFKKDDKIGLWNAVTNEKHVIDINMACLENDYSWRLNLETAKRLSNDKHSPQGIFVYRLRVSPSKHLVYTNTEEVQVTSVCEKTKWKYWWNDDYVVEVTRYEFWNCEKYMTISPGVEIILDRDGAVNTSYGVTFYRKSWDDDFAFNCSLGVGEAPDWHPTDILDRDKTGGVDGLLQEIHNFIETLEQKVPIRVQTNSEGLR